MFDSVLCGLCGCFWQTESHKPELVIWRVIEWNRSTCLGYWNLVPWRLLSNDSSHVCYMQYKFTKVRGRRSQRANQYFALTLLSCLCTLAVEQLGTHPKLWGTLMGVTKGEKSGIYKFHSRTGNAYWWPSHYRSYWVATRCLNNVI